MEFESLILMYQILCGNIHDNTNENSSGVWCNACSAFISSGTALSGTSIVKPRLANEKQHYIVIYGFPKYIAQMFDIIQLDAELYSQLH